MLLRRVIGDALRARRQAQHRTLREVSTVANVSLGYLSEIERGQKEASSELLSSICDALGAHLSEVLRDASDTMALAEQMDELLIPAAPGTAPAAAAPGSDGPVRSAARGGVPIRRTRPVDLATDCAVPVPTDAGRGAVANPEPQPTGVVDRDGEVCVHRDGDVSVAVHRDGPLRTTLRTRRTGSARGVAYAG